MNTAPSPPPLAREVWEHRHSTSLEDVLRSDPELRAIAKRNGWFRTTIERIEREEAAR